MFAGCVELTGQRRIGDQLVALAQNGGLAGIPFDEQAIWQQTGVTLIQQRQWHTPESRLEKAVIGDAFSKILFWGRIDNRPELIVELADAVDPELVKTDTGLVLNAWKYWGPDCCAHLVGDFAFVVYQPDGNHLFLARDHFGVKPLYFYRTAEVLVFATSLAVLTELRSLELTPSKTWMVRFVLGISADWRLTAFESVEKIQPAHSLLWTPESPDLPQQAWYEFNSPLVLNLLSDEAYVRLYRDVFHRAVKDRLRSCAYIGAECSGGLDSSSICASAAMQMSETAESGSDSGAPDPQKALGLFAMISQRDEPAAIQQVSEQVRSRFLYVLDSSVEPEDVAHLPQEYIQVAGCPPEQGNAIAQLPFYREAGKQNINVMLSGFGGDEFSTTYATTALVEFWCQRKWRLWASRFRGNWAGSKLRMLKWLYRYWRFGPGTETAQRLLASARRRWELKPIADDAIWTGLQEQVENQSGYDRGARSLNEFILNDRLSPLISARLESCTLMAARYGIEYRWPLLDIRLVEFFLAVPAEHKLGRGGIGRYLHRRAVADILPAEIVWRDKDMGPPIAEAELLASSEKNPNKNLKYSNINNMLKNIVNVNYFNNLHEILASNTSPEPDIAESFLEQIGCLDNWLAALDAMEAKNE